MFFYAVQRSASLLCFYLFIFVVFEVIDRVFAVLLFVILMAATRPIVPHFELGEILCLGGFLFSQISVRKRSDSLADLNKFLENEEDCKQL